MQTSSSEPEKKPVDSVQSVASPVRWWRSWWRSLSPVRQDRFAALAPLAAVLMFLAAILTAFWYLRMEELDREQEALRRDVEYAQQRVRLRLLERQEQLMRVARDLSNRDLDRNEFANRTEDLISQYPELQAITWVDEQRRIRASQAAPTVASSQLRMAGEVLRNGEAAEIFGLVRQLQQPVYSQPVAVPGEPAPLLQLQVPLAALVPDDDSALQAMPRLQGLPKLIYHSLDDQVVPLANGVQLYQAAPPPRVLQPTRGEHVQTFNEPVWREVLLRFLDDPQGFTGLRRLAEAPAPENP